MSTKENFIGVYDNVLTKSECQEMIRYYDEMDGLDLVVDHKQYGEEGKPGHKRKDSTIFMFEEDVFYLNQTHHTLKNFLPKFWPAYKDYVEEYSMLKAAAKHGIRSIRVQKTPVGGGFHEWHFETDTHDVSSRIITWMMYLNDVDEGGETEFLYYPKRVKPQAGRLLIWPAGFTHAHRGNPPLSNTKYILTGWLNLLE
jgi:hypothetical protein